MIIITICLFDSCACQSFYMYMYVYGIYMYMLTIFQTFWLLTLRIL